MKKFSKIFLMSLALISLIPAKFSAAPPTKRTTVIIRSSALPISSVIIGPSYKPRSSKAGKTPSSKRIPFNAVNPSSRNNRFPKNAHSAAEAHRTPTADKHKNSDKLLVLAQAAEIQASTQAGAKIDSCPPKEFFGFTEKQVEQISEFSCEYTRLYYGITQGKISKETLDEWKKRLNEYIKAIKDPHQQIKVFLEILRNAIHINTDVIEPESVHIVFDGLMNVFTVYYRNYCSCFPRKATF